VPDEPTDPGAAIRSPPPQRDRTTGDLPHSFRIRRPVLVDRTSHVTRGVRGRSVLVLGGDSSLADAIREELESHGAQAVDSDDAEARPDAVIDLGMPLLDAFALAQTLHDQPPRMWMCVHALGADSSWAELGVGAESGARAGFAKAIGREWETDASVGPRSRSAPQAERSRGDGALGARRRGRHDRGVPRWPAPAHRRAPDGAVPAAEAEAPGAQVVVLTGGTRGVTARVAKALARRGP
jgi:hypothetical protein